MGKAQKSSASSATRKKHAARKAGVGGVPDGDPAPAKEKRPKGKDKKSKAEPRKKSFVPVVKPAPPQRDPLDALGLAHVLPPDLYVVLRRFGKKDAVTKARALEELQNDWVEPARGRDAEAGEQARAALADALPVWLHHLPSLLLNSSRRIRALAAGLHTALLRIPPLRTQIFYFIRDVASADQAEAILGAWCMAAHDVDRQTASLARTSWTDAVLLPPPTSASASASASTPPPANGKLTLDADLLAPLLALVQRAALDPAGVHAWLNPPAPAPPPPPAAKKGARTAPAPKRDDADAAPRRADEDEERPEDRAARLRIGALGALGWLVDAQSRGGAESVRDGLRELLANPALWTALQYAPAPPRTAGVGDLESFGHAQPGVRRAAWTVLQVVLQRWKGDMEALLPVLSTAVLRAAWVEPDELVRESMWAPLLTFLTGYHRAWEIDASASRSVKPDEDDGSEEGSDDDEGGGGESAPPVDAPIQGVPSSEAYTEFLRFLELGCSGTPVQGYPAVVVVLSTIPPSVFAASSTDPSPASALLASFWAALDGRALSALDRAAAGAAFLSALLDVLALLARRARDPAFGAALLGPAPEERVRALIGEQLARAWDELRAHRLRAGAATAGTALARALAGFERLGPALFDAAWAALAGPVRASLAPGATAAEVDAEFVLAMVQALGAGAPEESGTRGAVKELVRACAEDAVGGAERAAEAVGAGEERSAGGWAPLVGILDHFGSDVWADEALANRVSAVVRREPAQLLTACPKLVLVYLAQCSDDARGAELWGALLSGIAAEPSLAASRMAPLLNAAEGGKLASWAKPAGPQLDALMTSAVADSLSGNGNGAQATLGRRILSTPEPFISSACLSGLLESTTAAVEAQVEHALTDESVRLSTFRPALEIFDAALMTQAGAYTAAAAEVWPALLPDLFLIAHVLSAAPGDGDSADAVDVELTKRLWNFGFKALQDDERAAVLSALKLRLQEYVLDPTARLTSRDILRVYTKADISSRETTGFDILPGATAFDAMLEALSLNSTEPSLAVNDVLVPPDVSVDDKHVTYDRVGVSTYGRAGIALIQVLSEDRQIAKANLWALRHALTTLLYAEDWLLLRSASRALLSLEADRATVHDIATRARQVVAYLLGGDIGDAWHSTVVSSVSDDKVANELDGLGTFVVDLVKRTAKSDSVQESRMLHVVLQYVLRGSEKSDADQWMLLARKLEKSAPQTSLVIVHSVARSAAEPSRLDRYRNELAANLLGIAPAKANTDGLLALRRLAAAAPDLDSDVVFLPQLRAVNLMKACQQWVSSDEEIDEEVESAMTLVFLHLAPILQYVPGAHWDMMFDVIENNLEFTSFADDSTLVTLARTLRLVIAIQDLCTTNKALRAVWQERQSKILIIIRDLTAARLALGENVSGPRSTCRELALSIIQDLPPALIDQDTLPSMCHLVTDSSVEVQKMAYQLLRGAAAKRTETIVIEAGVDAEGSFKPELPLGLVDLLSRQVDIVENDIQTVFGYLLGWMLAFDLFTDASIKVKSGYSDHLQDLGIIATRFLPTVYTLLDVYSGVKKAFKLDMWTVDEYYIQLFDADVSLSLQLLAAHLYYRSLLLAPSLVRVWLDGCKDRTLLASVTGYTSQHFSRVIVDTELARIRDPAVLAELADENTTVKVSSAVNEVTAAYTVDEQALEITLKLPTDWPLHAIEVRDNKRVAIPEDRWRAWILGVQRIIWSQNGTIADGLTFFKKNVSLHFEGMVECAICYSIIGVTDNTLPRKPCRTCKNRFHASCLYKWFNTSHSSSCPLCRSEIL